MFPLAATNTPMLRQSLGPDVQEKMTLQGMEVIDADDVAKAIVWLLGFESAQVSGVNLPVGPGVP